MLDNEIIHTKLEQLCAEIKIASSSKGLNDLLIEEQKGETLFTFKLLFSAKKYKCF